MSDGATYVIRHMRRDEVESFYEAVKTSAAAGQGYGVDELPDFEYFVRNYVHNFYNFVVETADADAQLVAFRNFGPSVYARSIQPVIVDSGNMVVSKKFRHKNIYAELVPAGFNIFEKAYPTLCGFQGDLASTMHRFLSPNIPGFAFVPNGIVPRGIYFSETGWTDLHLM